MYLSAIPANSNGDAFFTYFLIGLITFVVLWTLIMLIPFKAWRFIRKHDLNITLTNLVGMRIRRTDPMKVARTMLLAKKVGIDDADVVTLEAHMLCGATVEGFIEALIEGRKAGITIPFQEASMMYIRNEGLRDEIQRRIKEKGYVGREEA